MDQGLKYYHWGLIWFGVIRSVWRPDPYDNDVEGNLVSKCPPPFCNFSFAWSRISQSCVIFVTNNHTTIHPTPSILRNDDPNPLRRQLQKRFPAAINKSPHSIKRPVSQFLSWLPQTLFFSLYVDLVELVLVSSSTVDGEMVGELE
jgi:hypothetical protein